MSLSKGRGKATAEVFRALQRAGVDALLLKGPALEQALYHAGEQRSYSDVDVLVAPGDRAAARRLLSSLGYLEAPERGIDDVGGVDSELFHDLVAGRAHAEAMKANDFSVETDVLIPNVGDARFDRNAATTRRWKNFFTIFSGLSFEAFEAGH